MWPHQCPSTGAPSLPWSCWAHQCWWPPGHSAGSQQHCRTLLFYVQDYRDKHTVTAPDLWAASFQGAGAQTGTFPHDLHLLKNKTQRNKKPRDKQPGSIPRDHAKLVLSRLFILQILFDRERRAQHSPGLAGEQTCAKNSLRLLLIPFTALLINENTTQ